jgi:DHA1 family tetracycline resistance protein-like MFS transporter
MNQSSPFANRSFIFILVTAFLSVMGIGIVIPVLPFLIGQFVSPQNLSWYIGLLTSLYALCQFFASPVLGAASDAFGRRPVLLFCQLGSAIGYLVFGLAASLPIFFLGRAIDGITGGDISTAFAYVADITKPQDRAKYFGVIGATVGLGFILGPSLGGLLSLISLRTPFYVAAVLTLANMTYGYFFLPETLEPANRSNDFSIKHLNPLASVSRVLNNPALRSLLSMGVFYFLAFSMMGTIMAVFYKDTLGWNATNIGTFLLTVGIGDMIIQGYVAGKLSEKYGARPLVIAGFLLSGLAFAINIFLPAYHLVALAFVFVVIYTVGSGLFEPAYGGLISESAGPSEQGRVQGASQSVQSLTRIVGPLLAAALYQMGHSLPWIVAVALSLIGAGVLVRQKTQQPTVSPA